MSRTTNILALWAGVVIFAASGLFCVLAGGMELLEGYRSTSWPSVGGHVVASEVTSSSGSKNTGSSGSSYTPRIKYRYTLGVETYNTDRIRFGSLGGAEATARRYVGMYPAGAQVEVFYKPAQPGVSVLEPGWTGRSLLFFLVGFPLMGMGYLFFRVRNHLSR